MQKITPRSAGLTSIAAAAQASGVSPANIRYYEQQGLIPKIATAANGYRRFSAADVQRLRFVRRLRSLGMSLDAVGQFLRLDLHRPADCAAAQQAVDGHLQHVNQRIAELQALADQLAVLSAQCDGHSASCKIIEALGDPDPDVMPGAGVEPICQPPKAG